jgi:hypothetical protein
VIDMNWIESIFIFTASITCDSTKCWVHWWLCLLPYGLAVNQDWKWKRKIYCWEWSFDRYRWSHIDS